MFWGLIMESGKRYTQTVERAFHVSMACLEPNTADNENVSVMLAFEKKEFILCNLNKHKVVQTQLDLNFQSGDRIAFMSSGKGRVHLTGYLLETDDDEDDDDMSGEDLENENSIVVSDSPKNSVKGSSKRKNEPTVVKPGIKKLKLEPESPAKSSDEEEDSDEDSDLDEDSEDLLVGNVDEEDDDDDDDDDNDSDSDEDEDESDDEIEDLDTSKGKALNMKNKNKKANILANESQQNKNKSPNDKQKNRSLIEKQQKNKTPEKHQQQQQKNKTPNEKQGGNTPNQKTPGGQMNGMAQQQQSGKKNKKGMDTPKGGKSPGGETPGKKVLEGGVIVEDLKQGNGPVAKAGRQVSVYYVGRLKNNNKQFDSTTEGAGFKFRLGRGEVIKGWDIGLTGMKVGGKRKVTCPAALAYGNKGAPPSIPPNSTLVFDVELKAVN